MGKELLGRVVDGLGSIINLSSISGIVAGWNTAAYNSSKAGASGIACLEMLVKLGAKKENIWLCDSKGLITKNRSEINEEKKRFQVNYLKMWRIWKKC